MRILKSLSILCIVLLFIICFINIVSAIDFDDFDSPILNPDWTFISLNPSSSMSLTANPGFLRIVASPLNGGSDLWEPTNFNAPRLLQSASGDWDFETRVLFDPTYDWSSAEIVMFDKNFNGTTNKNAFRIMIRGADGFNNDFISFGGNRKTYDGIDTYMRVQKRGTTYSGFYSNDGINWNSLGTLNSTFPEEMLLGIAVVRQAWFGFYNESVSADFDYIKFTQSDLNEKSSSESTLVETILSKKAVLNNALVSGDFNSTLNFSNFEIVHITTGPFAGKGFSKGRWETALEGISYQGNWQGAIFSKPQEAKIYLKGSVSGGISGTVDGYLTESVPGSGIYNQYQATWKIVSGNTSAIINLNGTLSYQSESEFPNTELYFLQTSLEGDILGDYTIALSTVLTHIRVADETNPYYGEGFSLISYTSESGSGEGWTYDNVVSPGKIELKGLFSSPLFGIVSATLNESPLPRILFITIRRVDLGSPAPDLKVTIWGPSRISPGQTVNYIIEYRNDGLKAADDIAVVMLLPDTLSYISSSEGSVYVPPNSPDGMVYIIRDIISPSTKDYLSVTVRINLGLPLGQDIVISSYVLPKEVAITLKFPCNFDLNCDEGEDPIACPDCWNSPPCLPSCNNNGICESQLCEYSSSCSDCVPGPDNTWSSQVVTASDPNIKYGPEGNVTVGQKLDYKVEYENEGEGIAFGVYFTDTLDEDLDDSTLEIGPVISTINGTEIAPAGTYNPATRTITWMVGEVGSGEGGYAEFSVNVKSDAPKGTEIINFATVYFPSVPEATRTNAIVSVIPILENNPPVASAGSDQTVSVGNNCLALVTLDGTGSSDPDENPLTYTWTWDGSTVTGKKPTIQFPLGTYTITLIVNDGTVDSEPDTVEINVVDSTSPNVEIKFPESGMAVQDSVTLTAQVSDNCGISEVYFYIREPNGTNGNPIGYENLLGTLNNTSGKWEYNLNTILLQDGNYVLVAKAIDTNGNEGWSEPVSFSIRNWAVLQLLPSSQSYKAGRTMPTKFSLRIASSVDPAQPFVYNEDLEIRIYDAANSAVILQLSIYGDSSTDYRIDTITKLYITNFKTLKNPATYVVEVWRKNKNFLVGSFTFKTVK